MSTAAVTVRCIACNEQFDGIELYDRHMWSKHGLETGGKEKVEQGIANAPTGSEFDDNQGQLSVYSISQVIKEEPLDTGYVNVAQSNPLPDEAPLPYPVTLTKTVFKTDSQDEETEQDLSNYFIGNLLQAKCPNCNMDFAYTADLNHHLKKCKAKKKKPKPRGTSKNKQAEVTQRKKSSAAPTKSSKKNKASTAATKKKERKNKVAEDKVVSFDCDQCGKSFRSASTLKRHIGTHKDASTDEDRKTANNVPETKLLGTLLVKKDEKTEKSLETSAAGSEKSPKKGQSLTLLNQRRVGKRGKTAKCVRCGITFDTKYQLEKHRITEHGNHGYQCQYCDKTFHYRAVLRTHERTHTGETPFQCSYCGKKFNDGNSLKRHERLHGKVRHYNCRKCDERFRNPYQLRKHMAVEHGKACSYQCAFCHKGFFIHSHWKEHQRTHTKEKPYVCSICSKAFSAPNSLKRHERTHTQNGVYRYKLGRLNTNVNSKERRYSCVICNKKFLSKSHLKGHEFIHTGETPFECSYCEKKFNARNSLKRHEALHSGEKICKCRTCGESYNNSYQLHKHIEEMHQAARPYQCSYCEKGFLVRSHLTQHQRTHTKEKPYSCSYCSKPFSASNSLKRHEKIHTNDRAHQCTKCEKAFITLGDLKKHLNRAHSDERPFACDVEGCTKRYKCVSDLRKHKDRHETVDLGYDENGEHKCLHCDLAFVTMKARRYHVNMAHRSKVKVKVISCPKCHKEFASEKCLEMHEKTHSGETFQCEYCGQGYIDQRLFDFHARTHLDEKPFSCSYCDYSCKNLLEMKSHIAEHLGEATLACRYCDRKFYERPHLDMHEKSHGKRKHKCEVCEKLFNCSSHLKGHMKTHLKVKSRMNSSSTGNIENAGRTEESGQNYSDDSDGEVSSGDETERTEEIHDSDLDLLHSDTEDHSRSNRPPGVHDEAPSVFKPMSDLPTESARNSNSVVISDSGKNHQMSTLGTERLPTSVKTGSTGYASAYRGQIVTSVGSEFERVTSALSPCQIASPLGQGQMVSPPPQKTEINYTSLPGVSQGQSSGFGRTSPVLLVNPKSQVGFWHQPVSVPPGPTTQQEMLMRAWTEQATHMARSLPDVKPDSGMFRDSPVNLSNGVENPYQQQLTTANLFAAVGQQLQQRSCDQGEFGKSSAGYRPQS